jgi:ankyrin repeat protein
MQFFKILLKEAVETTTTIGTNGNGNRTTRRGVLRLNLRDNDGNTPWMIACRFGTIEILKEFLRYRQYFGINAKNKKGFTGYRLALLRNTSTEFSTLLDFLRTIKGIDMT